MAQTSKALRVTIEAVDRATRPIRAVVRSLGTVGTKLVSVNRVVARTAKATLTAVTSLQGALVALVGVLAVVNSARLFIDVERRAAEVATLVGGMGRAEIDALSESIRDAAVDGGQAFRDEFRAAYDAVSSGVEARDLTEFLRTANRLAVGGVTDVGTAVDLLTSSLNAYNLDAAQAGDVSDIFFTAVKVGKTTVEELAQSLFQVAPAANASGVALDQVAAALATVTAAGTPTKVAATGLRAAIVELGREGTKAGDAFRDAAGVGFRQFLAEGGTLLGVLEILAERARVSGVAVQDLFASVEAGQPIQVLATTGLERFSDSLDLMASRAGATEAAFETMSDTIGFRLDRLRVGIADLIVEGVDVLAPSIRSSVDVALEQLDNLRDAVKAAKDAFADPELAAIRDGLVQDLVANVARLMLTIGVEVGRVIGTTFVEAVSTGITAIAPQLEDVFRDTLGPILSEIPGVEIELSERGKLREMTRDVEELTKKHVELRAERLRLEAVLRSPAVRGSSRLTDKFEVELGALSARMARINEQILTASNPGAEAAQAEIVARQQRERARELAAAFESSFGATSEAAERAATRINAAGDDLSESTRRLVELLGDVGVASEEVAAETDGATRSLFDLAEAGAAAARGMVPAVDADRIVEFFRAIPGLVAEARVAFDTLEARRLSAAGDEDAAARLRLELQHHKERTELVKEYGDALAGQLLPTLLRVQAVESDRLAFDQSLEDAKRRLAQAEATYGAAAQRRADAVEQGTLSQERARVLARESRDEFRALAGTLIDQAEAWRSRYPAFAADVGAYVELVNQALQRMGSIPLPSENTLTAGLDLAIEDLKAKAQDVAGFAQDTFAQVAGQISTGLASAIVDVASGAKSAEEAFRSFLSSTLRMVAQLILQFLILRAISGFLGGGAGSSFVGPPAPGANRGGFIARGGVKRYATGGFVPGPNVNADVVPALLTPGEAVLNRRAVRAMGRGRIAELNATGQAGGGVTVVVEQTNTFGGSGAGAADAQRVKQAAREGVLEAIERSPAYRDRFRRGIR